MFFESTHKQVASRKNVDFQSRMYDMGVVAPPRDCVTPCVVVFTQVDDMETSDLSFGLAQEGIRLLRVNVDEPSARSVTGIDGAGNIMGAYDVLKPVIAWTRHSYASHLAHSADPIEAAYIASQGESFRTAIKEIAPHQINGRVQNTHRLSQMRIAREAGLRTPRTVVTSALASVETEISTDWGDEFIVKAIGEHWIEEPDGVLNGIFPTVVTRTELKRIADEQVPLIIQEFISHTFELRIYVIGSDVIAYRIPPKRDAASIWTDPDSIGIQPVDLEEDLLEQIYMFRDLIHLDIGAIDLLIGPSGKAEFLEVNFAGDWRYFEGKAKDTRVTDAVKAFFKEKILSAV